MTEEQAKSLYHQGEEAVVAILLDLFRRVQMLEEQVAKNSNNSSKPPSSDSLSKPPLKPMPQSLRKKTGKKPGGQKGQAGKTLLPVENPDQIVWHRPLSCSHCQTNLQDASEVNYTRRQVFEMPEPKIVVTEHRRISVACPCCGKQSQGTFPREINHSVQYGPHLLGFATYLHSVHLLPYARCAKIVQEVTGAPFSPGSLHRALQTASHRLTDFEQVLKKAVGSAPVLHVDETGGRVAGKLGWFHVRCTPRLCYLFHHTKRGKEAVQDLQSYSGRLVSDFYSNYVSLSCSHQFCGAHLLRELTFAQEVLHQKWAGSLKAVLEAMVEACHAARETGKISVEKVVSLERAYDHWVQEGLAQNPLSPKPPGKKRIARGKVRCLLDRLRDYRNDYLGFLWDLFVPFTNNEAERDIRLLKVKGRISNCFRTEVGADLFCRLRSYLQTCHKQGMSLLECLRSVFVGRPLLPSLIPI